MAKIILPTKKAKPTNRWIDQKFLMIGPGKIGKSDFWSKGEKTFFYEFETGLNHLSVMKLPIRSWDEFSAVSGELYLAAKEGKFPYDTLVVDTVDVMVDRAAEEVVDKAKGFFKKVEIQTIGDIPEGKGWYEQRKLVAMALRKLEEFPAAVVLIGHVKAKELTAPDGGKFTKDTISIGGQVGGDLVHWADHTLHMRARYTGERLSRQIRTKPTESLEAGSRGNVVEDGFEIKEPLAETYKKFRALFD